MFTSPIPPQYSIALDPTHPITTTLQETLNPKTQGKIFSIGQELAECRIIAARNNVQIRFDYPSASLGSGLIWIWKMISEQVFGPQQQEEEPKSSTKKSSKFGGSLYTSSDAQGNIRYGLQVNENLPRQAGYHHNNSINNNPRSAFLQLRVNRKVQPYLDTVECKVSKSHGLQFSASVKFLGRTTHTYDFEMFPGEDPTRDHLYPFSRIGIGLASDLVQEYFELFDEHQRHGGRYYIVSEEEEASSSSNNQNNKSLVRLQSPLFRKSPSAKQDLLKCFTERENQQQLAMALHRRISAEYYSQFPKNFIAGELDIHKTDWSHKTRRGIGDSYLLCHSSLCLKLRSSTSNSDSIHQNDDEVSSREFNSSPWLSPSYLIWFDCGAWLNTFGPSGSLAFGSLTIIDEKRGTMMKKYKELVSKNDILLEKKPFYATAYDRYRDCFTYNLSWNSDSGPWASFVAPITSYCRLASGLLFPVTADQRLKNKTALRVICEFEMIESWRDMWNRVKNFFIRTASKTDSDGSVEEESSSSMKSSLRLPCQRGTCFSLVGEVADKKIKPKFGIVIRG